MGFPFKRSAAEWFAAAEQWYLEGHQGCVNCGDQHCVFHSESESLHEFYCYSCDFSVCRDRTTGRHYVWGAGQINPQPCPVLEKATQDLA